MPWYGRGYNLHPDNDRQMIREAESLRKRGLCVLDATSMIKCTTRSDHLHMENSQHNRLQTLRFFSHAGALGYHLSRLRSCKALVEMAQMKKRREESLANPLPQNEPQWEEMEEVMVSVIVDGWEMYVTEKRAKGQRLENEVDPEKASLHMIGIASKEAADETGSSTSWTMVEAIPADLPGKPEHFEVHETAEQDVDDDIIDAMLQPYVDKLPHVSDEPDQDEDEEIVFRDPIVGGSAAHLPARRKAKPFSANKIHAVEFRLDGSGVVNILNIDVTRDPAKLEMRFESTQETADGPRIIRRYDLNDEEQHRQVERELYLEELAPEAKLRAGDPAASIEIVSKAKAKPEAPHLPRERADHSLWLARPEGYPNWYHFSPGTGELNEYIIRCNELPGLENIAPFNGDDFRNLRFLAGHKDLQPHHRITPPEFNNDLYVNFEEMYVFLRKRFRHMLSKEDLYFILRTQDRFMCRIQAGAIGQLTTLDLPYRITHVKAIQGHDQSLIEQVGTAPLIKNIISLDDEFGVEEYRVGLMPRVPCFPHLAEAEVPEEFKTVYHYTSWNALQAIICTGIFLGAMQRTRVPHTSCPLGN
eukprot:s1156_g45.t1